MEDLLDDPQIAVVVELIGGVDQALALVRGALERGKHVVTANKALLATRGDEIFRLAREKGVDVYYEGAVCGGVPIIRTLREALASDRISSLHGIVNGTTNFILTAMAEKGEPIEAALAEAQRLGYAEADPTLDVSGRRRRPEALHPRPARLRRAARAAGRPHRGDHGALARGLPLGARDGLRAEAPRDRAALRRAATRSRRACTRPSSPRARSSPACAAR